MTKNEALALSQWLRDTQRYAQWTLVAALLFGLSHAARAVFGVELGWLIDGLLYSIVGVAIVWVIYSSLVVPFLVFGRTLDPIVARQSDDV